MVFTPRPSPQAKALEHAYRLTQSLEICIKPDVNRTPRLLIIEDDPSLRKTIQLFLGVAYEAHGASNLVEARQCLKAQEFEVILLDKGLPDGDGLDLLPEIKASFPECAVIVLSGDNALNSVSRAMAAGADDYTIKSELAVVDLMVRIPIALDRIKAWKSLKGAGSLLPQSLAELHPQSYRDYLSSTERAYVEKALELCNRDVSDTARRLGVSRATIFNKMSEFGIAKRSWLKRVKDDSQTDF